MNEYVTTAKEAARKAGTIQKQSFREHIKNQKKDIDSDYPTGADIVTEIDKQSENRIINYIENKHPDHNIIAEESGEDRKNNRGDFRWIIDPLDGTKNYYHGLPIYSVLIALEIDGKIEVGVVYLPFFDDMYHTVRKEGSFKNGKEICVSEYDSLSDVLVTVGIGESGERNTVNSYEQLILSCGGARHLGCAGYELAMVAEGRLGAFVHTSLEPWDIAAGALLVEEAGGSVTQIYDSSGESILETGEIIASNGLVEVNNII